MQAVIPCRQPVLAGSLAALARPAGAGVVGASCARWHASVGAMRWRKGGRGWGKGVVRNLGEGAADKLLPRLLGEHA